jgi:type I restriction-modification system DNA methylase subunit
LLDSVTKGRINSLRDILVGKVPDPKSQVEQITTALIYKFMYDLDKDAVEMGGVPSFFVDEFEKYSWERLFDSKLSGNQRVQLYTDAIERMYNNPNAPTLFREIFKNSFLPFKDPPTLFMFIKEVNEFNYFHSEQLGDAYEYLLSFMGSQGEAGQFRTPRHIIDFVVSLLSPQKNEKILDPACGTAGFLISSYRNIIEENTKVKKGDRLSAEERKILGENLNGYDISPDMVRISLVNMYLHGFSNPLINEYDSLSDSSKWEQYFDVILANPPFMTPKGGIIPHDRFSIKSKKAEVLFVDYILSHLKPSGRAAIIVPEGINFVGHKAYGEIRRNLLDQGLICDITLPHGVFKPYASVKTHILIINREISLKFDDVLFIEIDNDGFTQSDTRQPVQGEQLSPALQIFKEYCSGGARNRSSDPIAICVSRKEIAESKDTHLIGRWYDLPSRIKRPNGVDILPLQEICRIEKGASPNMNTPAGDYQMVVPAPNFKTADRFDFEGKAVCIPLVSAAGHGKADIKRLHFVEGKFALANTMCAVFSRDESVVIPEYLFVYLTTKMKDLLVPLMKGATNVTMDIEQLVDLDIPIPSIGVQTSIASKYLGKMFSNDVNQKIQKLMTHSLDGELNSLLNELSVVCERISSVSSHNDELDKLL